MRLPDGLVAVVKRDCPTCVLVEPVLRELGAAVWCQDDAEWFDGDVTVSFDALSYAGTLTVTAVADPDRVPDLPVLTAALRDQLAALVTPAPTASR